MPSFVANSKVVSPQILKTISAIGHFKYETVVETQPNLNRTDVKYTESNEKGEWYEGQINKETKQREGRGNVVFSDGSYYEGYWKADLASGRGRLIHTNGDFYEGEFESGQQNGYGRFMSTDNFLYEGYWKEN